MAREPRKPRQKPGARMGSEERSRRISAGLHRFNFQRRARGAVLDADLRALHRGELDCRPALRPFVQAGVAEAQAIVEALGGAEALSPQRQALARDLARLSAVAGALTAAFFRSEDPELVPKLTSTIQARRALLEKLGLDWATREKDLSTYLRERSTQKPAGNAIDVEPVSEPAPPADRSAAADAAREGEAPDDSSGCIPQPEGENDE